MPQAWSGRINMRERRARGGEGEPVAERLLDSYPEWLFYERRLLCLERWPGVRHPDGFIPANTGASGYHFPLGPERRQDRSMPST